MSTDMLRRLTNCRLLLLSHAMKSCREADGFLASELHGGLPKSEIHEIHEIQSLSRNPLSN